MKKLLLNTFLLLLATAGASAQTEIPDISDIRSDVEVGQKYSAKTLTEQDLPFTFTGKFNEVPSVSYEPGAGQPTRYGVYFTLELSSPQTILKVTMENAGTFTIVDQDDKVASEKDPENDEYYRIAGTGVFYGYFLSQRKAADLTIPYSVRIEEIADFVSEDESGNKIKSDKDIVGVGEFVTLMPRPAKGYEFESVSVSYKGENVCVNDNMKFIKPAGEFEVSATFTKTDEDGDENPDNGGNQNPTDVEDVNVSAQSIVGEKFHTVLGQPLSEPQTSGVTVVTRTYSDGAVRSSKEVR